MYATAYVTPHGFASVGFLAGFSRDGQKVRIGDPVFGWQTVSADECFCVIFTESGYVLPDVAPMLSGSLVSTWLEPSQRLAANPESLWLEPEHGGDRFPSGYPLAWERIRFWRERVAADWRSLALAAIFARSSIQRPIEQCEQLYRMFGPTLRDALVQGRKPTAAQMRRYKGIKGTRAEARSGGLDDLRTFEEVLEWAPWAAEQLSSTDDMSRRVRDTIAVEWLPWGLGIAKLSFTMMLSGRDAACIDTRMLNYFYGEDSELQEEIREVPRTSKLWKPPATRSRFLRRVSDRSTAEGARGVTRSAVQTYSWLEGRLEETPYFDPDWPQPYAKAQWLLWETLGRTAGTAEHGALWDVMQPLIDEVSAG